MKISEFALAAAGLLYAASIGSLTMMAICAVIVIAEHNKNMKRCEQEEAETYKKRHEARMRLHGEEY